MWEYRHPDELYHYGVPGMKWSRRKARGHGGPGIYLNKKRQLAGDKRDLAALKRGEHLSVGLTKKRQEAFDKRDMRLLEKRIAKNERELAEKAQRGKKSVDKNKIMKKAITAAIVVGAVAGGAYAAKKYMEKKGNTRATYSMSRLKDNQPWNRVDVVGKRIPAKPSSYSMSRSKDTQPWNRVDVVGRKVVKRYR